MSNGSRYHLLDRKKLCKHFELFGEKQSELLTEIRNEYSVQVLSSLTQ